MNFDEAIDFSKKFRTYHPKIFKGFNEWGIWDTETEGYVVLTDSALGNEQCFKHLEDYVENHKLRIDLCRDYLMICTQVKFCHGK
jgi:hypothetical protein